MRRSVARTSIGSCRNKIRKAQEFYQPEALELRLRVCYTKASIFAARRFQQTSSQLEVILMEAISEQGIAYNYDTFTRSEGAGKTKLFKEQLRAGDEAPDFELTSLEGECVRLSSYRGQKHVLLEFGSIT